MNISIMEKRIPSCDGTHQLYSRFYIPEGEPAGLLHVVHGMNEHIKRYDQFMREIACQGWLVYGFDNLGHGLTAIDESELGYIGGWKLLVEDVRMVTEQMKKEYGKELPCVLLGHSMGSFIARCAATPKYWNKVIFMGTGGPNPLSGPGLALLKSMIKFKGERGYAPKIEKMLFDTYNKRFKDENDSKAWLSSLPEVRADFRADKYCMFHFTLSALYDLVKLQSLANSQKWFENISDKFDILLVSGEYDPVGADGKGVTEVYDRLKKEGKNVRMKLYPGCRHEILNEVCHDEVVKDIWEFINN